jgi:putative ABC transport system substrate-binding protein
VAVRRDEELEGAWAVMMRECAAVLLMTGGTVLQGHLARILAFAAEHRLPLIHQLRENAEAGGLMSYGTSRPHLFRGAAVSLDKISNGANPADLPLEQPMTSELVINLRTAQVLGLTIPPTRFFQATEVIR